MKILTGKHIQEADRYTIEKEPITSIDLMERASNTIAVRLKELLDKNRSLLFLIGKGNNGGDGLAVARILHSAGYRCLVYLAFGANELSEECQVNLNRLPAEVICLESLADLPANIIFVDALLGTGVSGALREPLLSLINWVNSLDNMVISIDLPSGMISEFGNEEQTIIKADITLSLEFPKLAMLLPEAGESCGQIEILPIGLSPDYLANTYTEYSYLTKEMVYKYRLKRDKFAHKGTYGHALLIAGSQGMMGAAILATGAALRSGCGLLTVHIPEQERFSLQTLCPSAILSLDAKTCFSEIPKEIEKYSAIAIGPGLGQDPDSVSAFEKLLNSVGKPLVLDADALNIIAQKTSLLEHLPAYSILTPHPGELKRLIGGWKHEQEKIRKVQNLAIKYQLIVLVKGAHTMICDNKGNCYFNSTGNNGMAKGGSGDVLTGYICGLLARGYGSIEAAILGVYTHGLAGDKLALKFGKEAINSKDLIDELYLDELKSN